MSNDLNVEKNKKLEPHAILSDAEAPRYTSYPSAHHFASSFDTETLTTWLNQPIQGNPVSLYVHVPFCPKMCWFCGCHTSIVSRHEPVSEYVQLLLKEISLVARHASLRGKTVRIHFGGGSPTMLEMAEMQDILHALRSRFEIASELECAIEIDPRHLTQEKSDFYSSIGINRASIGIQEFDPKIQQAINREQPYAMVAQAFQHLRQSGIHDINADLIYGLPYQNCETMRDTIEKVLTLHPSRIALFSYAHVPWVKKHQRMIPEESLPPVEEKIQIYLTAYRMLVDNGFVAIGMDHFARPGDPLAHAIANVTLRRNFQGYTDDNSEILIGLGLSAISQFPGGYAQNASKFDQYRKCIKEEKLPVVRGWQLSDEDRLRKAVIDHLMCYMEVDVAGILEQYRKPADYFAPELERLQAFEKAEVVEIKGTHIRVITPLRMAVRIVAGVFDQYLLRKPGVYSKVA